MQCCCLQHWILLSSPDISITECHFCFGPATSFFLRLLVVLLSSSPVAYWGMLLTWGTHLLVSYLFVLLYSSRGSQSQYTGVSGHLRTLLPVLKEHKACVHLCEKVPLLESEETDRSVWMLILFLFKILFWLKN